MTEDPTQDAIQTAQLKTQDAVAALLRTQGLSLTSLGRRLSAASAENQLGRSGQGTTYDAATIKRWVTGDQTPSRSAAWLLDRLYPQTGGGSFQDLRDQFVLAKDRAGLPPTGDISLPLLRGASCLTDAVARARERQPLPLLPGERLAFIFLSVVYNDESRAAIATMTRDFAGVSILAMYDLLGRWDLALAIGITSELDLADYEAAVRDTLLEAEMAEPTNAADPNSEESISRARRREFTAQRSILTTAARGTSDDDAEPRYIVLPTNAEYDLLRVQRSLLFVELETVAIPRRDNLTERLLASLRETRGGASEIVDGFYVSDTGIIIVITTTCAQRWQLNELNRNVEEVLSRFRAQKYNLIAYFADEAGWLARSTASRPMAP